MSSSSESAALANCGTTAQHNQQQPPDVIHLIGGDGGSDYQHEDLAMPQRHVTTNISFRRSLLTGIDVNPEGNLRPQDQTSLQQQLSADDSSFDGDMCSQLCSTQTTDFFVETFTRFQLSMELIVGQANKLHKFIVSEAHLRNLSPVWDDMVMCHSSFAQRRSGVKRRTKRIRVLRLPEEDPLATRLIMYIAHHRFSKLPKQLDFKDIVHLIDVAQRYKTMHLPQPYLKHWLGPYAGRLYDTGFEEWLYIGRHVTFASRAYAQLAQHLKLHCWTGDHGELLAPSTKNPIIGLLPPRALHQIKTDRIKLLKSIITSVYKYLNSMMNTGSCKVILPGTCSQCQECCTSTNHLKFTHHLKHLGLFPKINNASHIHFPVFEFVKMLKTPSAVTHQYAIPAPHLPCHAFSDYHHLCSWECELVVVIDRVLVQHKEREPVTSEDIAAYMNACVDGEIVVTTEGEDWELLQRLGRISCR